MPELLEVNTTKDYLLSYLPSDFELVYCSKHIRIFFKFSKTKEQLFENCTRIKSVSRHGKDLIFSFNIKEKLIVNFGMSGHWLVEDELSSHKHCHLSFKLNENTFFNYIDTRRFGKMKWIKDLKKEPKFSLPDPFTDSEFNENYLKTKLKNKNADLKIVLLDQNIFPGIGNYLASEILFHCKIHPQKKTSALTDTQIKKLSRSTKSILKTLSKYGGLSIQNYKKPDGLKGSAQMRLKVYARENLKCMTKSCSSNIKRIVQRQRSTFYCKSCQKY